MANIYKKFLNSLHIDWRDAKNEGFSQFFLFFYNSPYFQIEIGGKRGHFFRKIFFIIKSPLMYWSFQRTFLAKKMIDYLYSGFVLQITAKIPRDYW